MSRSKLFIVVIGMLVVAGALRLSSNVEVGLTTDALAASGNGAVSVQCTEPTQTLWVPTAAIYTVSFSAQSAGAASTPSTAFAYTGAVSGDTASGSVLASTLGTGASGITAGYVLATQTTPFIKIGGCQCQATCSTLQLSATGDGANNTAIDVAIQDIGDADNIYTSADNVDVTGTNNFVGGTSPTTAATQPVDGAASDMLALTDGEINAGAAAASGGTEMHVLFDVTNIATDSNGETLTIAGTVL